MLTPEELVNYKKKPQIAILSLGQKENEKNDVNQLEAKLSNIEELLATQRVKMMGQLSKGVWRPDINKAEILDKVGPFWDILGHCVDSKLFLYPEEALYLIDIAALELTFNSVPISVQRGYHLLLNGPISLDFYRVYSYLSLMGYKVMRHMPQNAQTKFKKKDLEIFQSGIKDSDQCGENSECDAILSRLRENGPKRESFSDNDMVTLPDFDIFLPNSGNFRKSAVQLPNFRVFVMNCEKPVPNFKDIDRNQKFFQDDVPNILAVVFPDFINFLQISSIELPILI